MSYFEIGMLICFGFAWPTNIYKSLKSRSIEGKSVLFLYVVFIGYLFGITHKIVYNLDIVIVFYIVNAIMVLIDLFLYYRNKRYHLIQEAA
ncbi:MAG: hypothetical protein JXB08_06470 [Bacilli bacterium]|nr:hypothetical protein [Bacilli bacterium]MBN2876503.1 hypothetical protein [Bacilli bacterium]